MGKKINMLIGNAPVKIMTDDGKDSYVMTANIWMNKNHQMIAKDPIKGKFIRFVPDNITRNPYFRKVN